MRLIISYIISSLFCREKWDELAAKYENRGEELEEEDEGMMPESTKYISQYLLQPSIYAPKMWLIKCRLGTERECVETLFHKYFSFKRKGKEELK